MTVADTLIETLSTHLFWDVERSAVDPSKHADFLIRRVMERGHRKDVAAIWEFYGEAKTREALVSAPALSRKTISFFAHQFSITPDAFRAHREASPQWEQ